MPASDTAYDVFYFLLSQDRRHVLICLPQVPTAPRPREREREREPPVG